MLTRIVRATLEHRRTVATLFNAYRVFYQQPSDLSRAEGFITERLNNQDSIILLAMQANDKAAGFVQLYPSFTSVGAQRILILNDLFVVPECRKQGVGRQLLEAARQVAVDRGVAKITLETAADNIGAQQLYTSLGYTRDSAEFQTYSLVVPPHPEVDTAPRSYQKGDRKVVVITGVTSGLGAAMVDQFNERNWMIAGCGRSVNEIRRLQERFGNLHYFDVVDVTNEESVNRWGRHIGTFCGGPDLVINNASIINRAATAWETSAQEFSDVMRTNVDGVVNVTRTMMLLMLPEARGTIINMSSGWGRAGDRNVAAYCASKFAVEGFTQSMALEVPKGMAVVTLDPRDGIATPMLSKCATPDYVATAPSPADWARVAVPFIISIGPEQNGQALTCPPVLKRSEVATTAARPSDEDDLGKKKPSNPAIFWKSDADTTTAQTSTSMLLIHSSAL